MPIMGDRLRHKYPVGTTFKIKRGENYHTVIDYSDDGTRVFIATVRPDGKLTINNHSTENLESILESDGYEIEHCIIKKPYKLPEDMFTLS